MDSYLSIAFAVLKKSRRPLDARQILKIAYQMSLVPSNLYGKTQYKTLHARLAENIRKERTKSIFLRTDPGKFFLREYLNSEAHAPIQRSEYPAKPRADQLRNFDVLCIPRGDCADLQPASLLPETALRHVSVVVKRLSEVEGNSEYRYLRVFVILERCGAFMVRKSAYGTRDTVWSKMSLGTIGYLKNADRTIFSPDPLGVNDASLRALSEQLGLFPEDVTFIREHNLLQPLGFLVAPNTLRENSVAALLNCVCPSTFDPIERYASKGFLSWHPFEKRINNTSDLDPWSKCLWDLGVFGRAHQGAGDCV